MSWFASTDAPIDPKAPTLTPVATSGPLRGALTAQDTAWDCETSKGFTTETQIWYSFLSDGSWFMIQIIFSVTGIMFVPPTVQFVFKHYDPKTKKATWKSINMSNWKANGQSGKSDQAEIKYTGSPTTEEVYAVSAKLADNLQLAITFTRPAETPGFKIGSGEEGGKSFYGADPKKREGYVVHRFLPVVLSTGHAIIDGKALDVEGEAMFVHAVQGMRPNLIARRWNFAFFASPPTETAGRTRAIQMEFITNDEHGVDGKGKGRNSVNIGAVVVDGKYQLVTSQVHASPTSTTGPIVSKATHVGPFNVDSATGYKPPSSVKWEWEGPSEEGEGDVKAWIDAKTGSGAVGDNGLIEKVDVLAEIPYLLKKVVAVVGSIKPYIYQHFDEAELHLTVPGSTEEKIIKGKLFDEITFITE